MQNSKECVSDMCMILKFSAKESAISTARITEHTF